MKKSLFANVLSQMLYTSHAIEYDSWQFFLGVTEDQIDDWLFDRDIPMPEHLRMIYEEIEFAKYANKEPLSEFFKICNLRPIDVSPHGLRMLPSIWQYMNGRVKYVYELSPVSTLVSSEENRVLH